MKKLFINNIETYRKLTLVRYIRHYGTRLIGIIILISILVPTSSAALQITPEEVTGVESTSQVMYSVFGAEETPVYVNDQLESGLTQLVNSKTKWVRGPEIVWSDIEKIENTYDWDKMQPAVDELEEIINLGYTPIVIIRGTPTWAQIPNSSTCGPIKATQFDDFGDFIQAAMNELGDRGIYVQFWEIWNEPDVDPSLVQPDAWYAGCWGNKSDAYYGGKYYGKMLAVVYPMIKSADPNAQVLVGGLNLNCTPINPHPDCDTLPSKFFQGILEEGGGNYFDGVSFHAYDGYGGEYGKYGNIWWNSYWNATGPSLIAKANYIRMLMNSYGVTGKYLMNSENALLCDPCNDDDAFEATKANYLADSYASAVANGLVANVWFDILGTWGRNNGLVDIEDLSDLPAMTAYNHASEMLEGALYVRTITEYEGVFGYEFKTPNPNYHVWMVRSIDGLTYTIQLTFPPYLVYDVYGEDITDQLTSDYKLDISVEPVYIVMPASVPRMALPYVVNHFKNFGNGNFEDGPFGWYFMNYGLPSGLVAENPNNPSTGNPDTYIPNGDYSAQLGHFGYSCNPPGVPLGYASVEQQLWVPDVPGQDVEIKFKYIIYSEDRAIGPPLDPNDYDRLEVYVLSASGSELVFSDANKGTNFGCSVWARVPGPNNVRDGKTTGWAEATIDLSNYEGESILLSFRNYNRTDGFYNTISFIDDVDLIFTP